MAEFNFNNTTPAAPSGKKNAAWQVDASGRISANYDDLNPRLTDAEGVLEDIQIHFCDLVTACCADCCEEGETCCVPEDGEDPNSCSDCCFHTIIHTVIHSEGSPTLTHTIGGHCIPNENTVVVLECYTGYGCCAEGYCCEEACGSGSCDEGEECCTPETSDPESCSDCCNHSVTVTGTDVGPYTSYAVTIHCHADVGPYLQCNSGYSCCENDSCCDGYCCENPCDSGACPEGESCCPTGTCGCPVGQACYDTTAQCGEAGCCDDPCKGAWCSEGCDDGACGTYCYSAGQDSTIGKCYDGGILVDCMSLCPTCPDACYNSGYYDGYSAGYTVALYDLCAECPSCRFC